MRQLTFTIFALLFFIYSPPSFASHTFTVTAFDGAQRFDWENGPEFGCSAINSYVMKGSEQQSKMFGCEATHGISVDTIQDGTYYIHLAVGGHTWTSQVFTIDQGKIIAPSPSPTPTSLPTPTPTIVNSPPVAVAGTSIQNNQLYLDASLSSDPEENSLTYTWSIEGMSAQRFGVFANINDLPAGMYKAILAVSDHQYTKRDVLLFTVANAKPQATINMKIKDFDVDKKSGSFVIRGEFDRRSSLFNKIAPRAMSTLLVELQTGGTQKNPVYGVIGYTLHQVDSIKK